MLGRLSRSEMPLYKLPAAARTLKDLSGKGVGGGMVVVFGRGVQ